MDQKTRDKCVKKHAKAYRNVLTTSVLKDEGDLR